MTDEHARSHVLVLGLGESGLAMARWCARDGARVRVVGLARRAAAGRSAARARARSAAILVAARSTPPRSRASTAC